jgi:hypothetical protein
MFNEIIKNIYSSSSPDHNPEYKFLCRIQVKKIGIGNGNGKHTDGQAFKPGSRHEKRKTYSDSAYGKAVAGLPKIRTRAA